MELLLTTMERHATLDDVRRLYVAHAPELRQALSRLAPSLDADDLLQELFLIVIDKPDALLRADSPKAWLYGVAVKLAATRTRTSKLRRFFGLSSAEHVTSHVDAPGRTLEQRDAQRAVSAALDSVSAAKRDAFVLFELQGLSGEEVAAALDIPLKTVWTRLFHARREVTAAVERQLLTEARTSGLRREEIQP
ncbi:MAG: RNA polymerase sigma factor [Archangium sp.]